MGFEPNPPVPVTGVLSIHTVVPYAANGVCYYAKGSDSGSLATRSPSSLYSNRTGDTALPSVLRSTQRFVRSRWP